MGSNKESKSSIHCVPNVNKPIPSCSEPLASRQTKAIKATQKLKPYEFDLRFVNEEHVADFVKALAQDPLNGYESGPEHISVRSDVIPTRRSGKNTVSKRRRRADSDSPKGWSQALFKYPLIAFIGTILFIELLLYIGLRQIVLLWENTFSWRGQRQRLRKRLQAAVSYEEWCKAADDLDKYMNKDEWKKSASYGYYDYQLVQKVIRHLRTYRNSQEPEDADNLKDVLYACLKHNFAGVENAKLYSNTYLGTKKLVEEYTEEVTKSIDALAKNPHVTLEDKNLAFKLYTKNYGRTAFCLSGGAGFGYFHLGVIRGLLDQKLLPSIITGTSAGSLMGSIVCTRTDDELREVLTPELARKIRLCQDSWFKKLTRYFTNGAIFDTEQWCREAMWFTRGSLTFKEAYERTGRVFNVSVIPFDPHSPPKLLNYITAPNCVIWSAVLASAAIPGILNPVVLMQKVPKTGRLIPYNYGHKFKDGSLRTDIPTQALYNAFNVNYTIVSQVNPHVHVFFYANQGSPGRPVTHRLGKGWRGGFLASTLEQLLKLDLSKWLKLLRDLNLLPRLLDQDWSSIWLQKFDGNVTILPKASVSDWLHILADPDEKRLEKLILSGELRTWPKISMISNRLHIETAIDRAKNSIRRSLKTQRRGGGRNVLERDTNIPGSNLSDDADGSADELRFLAGRRASMPGASTTSLHSTQDSDELRRRDFLAQFSDHRDILRPRSRSSTMSAKRIMSYIDDDDEDEEYDDAEDDNTG